MMALVELELAYKEVAVQHVRHYHADSHVTT